jgi:hypothetical protein
MQLLSVAKEVHSTFQEGSQETLATMSGMGLGMLLAHVNRGHDFAVWVSFLSLTIFHMFGECVITLFYAYRFFYHIVFGRGPIIIETSVSSWCATVLSRIIMHME